MNKKIRKGIYLDPEVNKQLDDLYVFFLSMGIKRNYSELIEMCIVMTHEAHNTVIEKWEKEKENDDKPT